MLNIMAGRSQHQVIQYFQCFGNSFNGMANVMAFLYSERMFTIRALGLPPGASPPYGFSAVLQDIPPKLALTGSIRRQDSL